MNTSLHTLCLILSSALAFSATATPALSSALKPVPPKAAAPVGMGVLHVNIAPWGDVIVDGVTRASSETRAQLLLPVGMHDVVVKNPWSLSERRQIRVFEDGAVWTVRLQPLPAGLIVHSNVDTEVLIDGVSVGRSWASEIEPLAIPLAGWQSRQRVRITLRRPGFKPLMTKATLTAGTRTVVGARLDWHLEPAPNQKQTFPAGSAPSPTP